MSLTIIHRTNVKILIILLAVLAFGLVVINTAWLSDDAYIHFRTTYNVVNGYGLTWQPPERLQTFTAPGMVLLQTLFYSVTRDIYYTTIFLSIAISITAVLILSFKISKTISLSLLGISALIMSRAFIDFSTSGAENPLTHLLLALFLMFYIKYHNNLDKQKFLLLSLIVGFLVLNRIDTILLVLPAILFCLFKLKKIKGIGILLIGLIPIIAWEIFALIYYGFPYPNSAYAKVLTIVQTDQIPRALSYFHDSLTWDPITLSVIGSAIFLTFIFKKWKYVPVIAGILLYFGFIFNMGGDFMSGRFFTATFLISIILIITIMYEKNLYKRKPILISSFAAIFIIGLLSPTPPVFSDSTYGSEGHPKLYVHNKITDERAIYYPASGLLRPSTTPHIIDTNYVIDEPRTNTRFAMKLRDSGEPIVICLNIGFFGWYVGPDKIVIDSLGLGDGFISKIPIREGEYNMVGHYNRIVPAGYIETVYYGENKIENENLAKYYDKLSIIQKSDDLFAWDRLKEIWNVNTGKYDYLIDAYDPPSNKWFFKYEFKDETVKESVEKCWGSGNFITD